MLVEKNAEQKVVKLLSRKIDYKELDKKQGWLSRISDGEMIPQEHYIASSRKARKKKRPKKKEVSKSRK